MNTSSITIPVFKSGRHADMSGTTLVITDADLTRTVAAYDPERWKAPLVIGHPRHDAPAWGWVSALSLENGTLMATLIELDPTVIELVAQGRYRNVSVSFYTPNGPGNPAPGVYYPRHVGLLGAQPPAVKGLPQVAFHEDASSAPWAVGEACAPTEAESIATPPQPTMESRMHDKIDKEEQSLQEMRERLALQERELAAREARFAEQMDGIAQREEVLRQAEEERKQTRAAEFVDALVADGRVLPRFRDGLVAFLVFLADAGMVEFAENQGRRAFLEGFLKELPRQVDYAEHTPAGRDPAPALRFQVPTGFSVDPQGLENHARILAHANAHHTDYLTAALAVNA
ncbi:MAG: peptidase [Magnetococcales bacterium]|nr:peptidase [Magnetococcales bacterium]